MKVLFLSQGRKIDDHPGWHDALEKLTIEGFIESFKNIPFFGYAEKYGWKNFYNEVVRLCREENYDVVYFHHFHGRNSIMISPVTCMLALKELPNPPIIITSVGDLFSYNWMMPYYPDHFKDASRYADITFSTQMGKSATKMMNWGAKNVVLSPLGMCQKRFRVFQKSRQDVFDFDLVFVGSRGKLLRINPISKAWWTSIKRTQVVNKLYKHFKQNLGLFGHNWNMKFSQGPIPFDQQQQTYMRGRFAIDAPALYCSDYYTSNRHLFQIASGTPTIMFETPRIKNIYRENDHCYYISSGEPIIERIDEILKTDSEELLARANLAANYIWENHTQYHRMRFKLDTVKRFINNGNNLDVRFPFFLPEIDLEKEKQFALRSNRHG